MTGRFPKGSWTLRVLSLVRACRWHCVLTLVAGGLVLSGDRGLAQSSHRSNKNVRTWTWAKDVVHPEVNTISRIERPSQSYQQITRQLLNQARRAAEYGDLQAAVELARRADALVTIARQTSSIAWDPAEQSPASFLRQLQMVHQQRLRDAEIRSRQRNERPGRVSLSENDASPASPSQSNPFSAPGPSFGPAETDHQALENWTAVEGGSSGHETGVAEERHAVDGGVGAEDGWLSSSGPVDVPVEAADSANSSAVASTGESHETESDRIVQSEPPVPAVPAVPLVRDRIVEVASAPESAQRSMWTDALVQLFSTAAGLILGIVFLVGVRAFIKRRYGADFGFIFRVEHVNAGGAMWYAPDETGILPFPTPKMDSGRDGAGAVLTDLPEGFVSDELSPYEEELRAAEEAEKEMMKFVFEKNLELRDELDQIAA